MCKIWVSPQLLLPVLLSRPHGSRNSRHKIKWYLELSLRNCASQPRENKIPIEQLMSCPIPRIIRHKSKSFFVCLNTILNRASCHYPAYNSEYTSETVPSASRYSSCHTETTTSPQWLDSSDQYQIQHHSLAFCSFDVNTQHSPNNRHSTYSWGKKCRCLFKVRNHPVKSHKSVILKQ